MPVIGDPILFDSMIQILCDKVKDYQFDRVLGIESRGFLIGPMIAHSFKIPFWPVRKKGKLPGDLFSVEYELEYGKDVLEIQKSALPEGSRCLIVDDLIATGGSLEATKKLVELSGSQVIANVVIIELVALKGREKLGDAPLVTLFSY